MSMLRISEETKRKFDNLIIERAKDFQKKGYSLQDIIERRNLRADDLLRDMIEFYKKKKR